jgi:glycine cleavage system aminomethyltransferase T
MRKLQLGPRWAGATLAERHGAEVVSRVADFATEYRLVRDAVALTDFSFVRRYRLPTDQGIDLLDGLLPGNVARVRYGRVMQTFMADDDGRLLADCYVANNDEELILLVEAAAPDEQMARIIREADKEGIAADLTDSHVLLSVDGFNAWAVVRDLFGADVLGLPYLSVELYPFADEQVYLFRAGKTSEFGYLLMAPASVAERLFDTLRDAVARHGGGLCGVEAHDGLRLEGRFFNVHAEGARVGDPLTLGLQWMMDFEKCDYRGAAAILKRRDAGLARKLIGVLAAPGDTQLVTGARLFHGADEVAEVVADTWSPELGRRVALAVFRIDVAYAGLAFALGSPQGPEVRTISMPPILAKSLSVKLDEM